MKRTSVSNEGESISQNTINENDSNQHLRTSPRENSYIKTLDDESIEKPSTYPFIEVNNEYIKIFIYNPDAGKEEDLIHFYNKSYWDLVGVYAEINVLSDIFADVKEVAPTIKGGEGGKSYPYTVFEGIINNLLGRKNTEPNADVQQNAAAESNIALEENTKKDEVFTKDTDKTAKNDDTHKDNTPSSLLSLNPVEPTPIVETNKDQPKDSSDMPNNNATSIFSSIIQVNEPSMKTDGNAIILTFTPNTGFKSFKDVIESRNPDMDIDITQSRFKYKELEKIELIKEKKGISMDICVEEVFYINGNLIVLKGMLNTHSSGDVKMESTQTPIETKKEMSNFMMYNIHTNSLRSFS